MQYTCSTLLKRPSRRMRSAPGLTPTGSVGPVCAPAWSGLGLGLGFGVGLGLRLGLGVGVGVGVKLRGRGRVRGLWLRALALALAWVSRSCRSNSQEPRGGVIDSAAIQSSAAASSVAACVRVRVRVRARVRIGRRRQLRGRLVNVWNASGSQF
eukprot:scaffold33790_cov60-Phaeocystis_antarctica.AAC.2